MIVEVGYLFVELARARYGTQMYGTQMYGTQMYGTQMYATQRDDPLLGSPLSDSS